MHMDVPLLGATACTLACVGLGVAASLSADRPPLWLPLLLVASVAPPMAVIGGRQADPRRVQWMAYRGLAVAPFFAGVAHLASVLPNFLVAWAVAPALFLCLYVLDDLNLVNYDVRHGRFLIGRMTFYAAARSLLAASVAHLGVPMGVDRLGVLALGSCETLLMTRSCAQRRWYDLEGVGFFAYAAVKSAWLLALPLVEEALLHSIC